MTQPFPPRQQQNPGQWGQQPGWPGQQVQQGWNRQQQGFGQQNWPQPQQPGGFQQGYPQQGYPQQGYQQPGNFRPAPSPQRGGGNPLGRILIMLVAVCGVLLVGVIVANMMSGRTPGADPRPTETYTPPPSSALFFLIGRAYRSTLISVRWLSLLCICVSLFCNYLA